MTSGDASTLAPELLVLLVDPEDKQPLLYLADEQSLYNPRSRRRYSVSGNIPVLLVDEAEVVSDDEHARLVNRSENDPSVVATGTPTNANDPATRH